MSRLADRLTRTDPRKSAWGGSGTVPAQPLSLSGESKSFGDWCRSVWRRDLPRLESVYRHKAALSESSGTIGGYTVPTEFTPAVLTETAEHSFFLRLATRVPMTTAETIVPHVDVTQGAAGTSPFYGGLSFTWTGEGSTLAETEPKFTATTLKAHTLTGYGLISNQMMEDAQDGELSAYLTELVGRAAAFAFDFACWRGTGVGQPQGVLNSPGAIDVTRTAGGDVQQADLAKMAAKLLPVGFGGFGGPVAAWGFHPSVAAKLMAVASWQVSEPAGAGDKDDPGVAINGWRAAATEKLPALGSRGDVVLLIPELYLVGMRQDVTVDFSRDEPTAFTKGQSVVRVTMRGDGRPRLSSAVTLADGAQTVAMIVILN